MPSPHDRRQNNVLAALPAEERACLFRNLELVPMLLGDVLHESGSDLRHVDFGTTSMSPRRK